jgi:hypothetical protein
LQEIETELKTTLAVPHEEWGQTRAAQLRKDRLDDAAALRKAVGTAKEWYRDLREEGEARWTLADHQPGAKGASTDWTAWQKNVGDLLLKRAQSPPFRDTDRLRGPDSPTWRDTVLNFTEVVEARKGWELTRTRLQRLLNLSAALGLGRVSDRGLLVFSPGPFPAAAARARREELKKEYPNYETEFTLDDLSETAKPDIRQAARTNYQNLLDSGREVVLAQIKEAGANDPAAPERRKKVAGWLQQGPGELADWRVLARTLRRLFDPGAVPLDPVDELAGFLDRDRFEIKLSRLSLAIKDDVRVELAEAGRDNLTVTHTPRQGKPTMVTLESRKGQYDAQEHVQPVTFRVTGEGAFVFTPGDEVEAKWPVRKPGEVGAWALSWISGRSRLYEIEHLSRGAWLHEDGKDPTTGKYYEDLRLVPMGDTRIPAVPDLMPVVK